MASKFLCRSCGKEIVVKFLKPGEIAKCKNCGAENEIPESAVRSNAEEVERERPKAAEKAMPLKVKRRIRGTILLILGIILFLVQHEIPYGSLIDGLIGGLLALGAIICFVAGVIYLIAGLVGKG